MARRPRARGQIVLAGKERITRDAKALPAYKFVLAEVELRFDPTRQPKEPIGALLPLAGLKDLTTLSIHEVRTLTDEDMEMMAFGGLARCHDELAAKMRPHL